MSDDGIWQAYSRNITRVKSNKIHSLNKPKLKNNKFLKSSINTEAIEKPIICAKLSRKISILPDQHLSYKQDLSPGSGAGVDKATMKAMDKGDYPIEDVIDLHGYNLDMAYNLLSQAISEAFLVRRRMLLVITGKGNRSKSEKSIKAMIGEWLNTPIIRPYVLRFSIASKYHGGEGAYYVLIRRNRETAK